MAKRRTYSAEQKAHAVRLVRQPGSVSQVATVPRAEPRRSAPAEAVPHGGALYTTSRRLRKVHKYLLRKHFGPFVTKTTRPIDACEPGSTLSAAAAHGDIVGAESERHKVTPAKLTDVIGRHQPR